MTRTTKAVVAALAGGGAIYLVWAARRRGQSAVEALRHVLDQGQADMYALLQIPPQSSGQAARDKTPPAGGKTETRTIATGAGPVTYTRHSDGTISYAPAGGAQYLEQIPAHAASQPETATLPARVVQGGWTNASLPFPNANYVQPNSNPANNLSFSWLGTRYTVPRSALQPGPVVSSGVDAGQRLGHTWVNPATGQRIFVPPAWMRRNQ